MSQHVIVADYNAAWEQEYFKEEQLIKQILKENCVEVYHIGSTSVPGLAAKPIIDILPVVKSLQAVDKVSGEFEKAGYEYLGEFGLTGRRYLRKGGDERTHQIHIFAETDRSNIERHVAFRDYMRTHADDRNKYSELKKELASKYPYDIERYCEGKDFFVKDIEAKALALYKSGKKQGE
ncbi:MAG: GrpB family protein [Lachnospiraceae bacterium]|nr:GrpB family protein [Lachnospiraceae bacterium]